MTVEDDRREQARLVLLALRRWKEAGYPRSLSCRFAWEVASAPSAITGRVRPPVARSYVAADRALLVADPSAGSGGSPSFRWIVWSSGRLSEVRPGFAAPEEDDGADADDADRVDPADGAAGRRLFRWEMPEQLPFVDAAMTTFEETMVAPGTPNSARWTGDVRLLLDGTARRWRDSGVPTRPPTDRPVLMAALTAVLADEVAAVREARVPALPTTLPPIAVPPRPRQRP